MDTYAQCSMSFCTLIWRMELSVSVNTWESHAGFSSLSRAFNFFLLDAQLIATLVHFNCFGMSTVYNTALKREAAAGKKRESEEQNDVQLRRNKQRVLMLPSRGITARMRHLINDLEALLPHAKKGTLTYMERYSYIFIRLKTRLQVWSIGLERTCRLEQLQCT